MADNYSTSQWPREELFSVIMDAMRLIRTTARPCEDRSCVALNIEELVADGRSKLIHLLEGGRLKKIANRKSLFGFFKTCFQNLFHGQVHKHRFTIKRMGRRVPPKGSGIEYDRSYKPEVSLSDPEVSPSIERAASSDDHLQLAEGEQDSDMREVLSPAEYLVYKQHVEPNSAALTLAMLDAWRGRRPGSQSEFRVDILDVHKAMGLGLLPSEFSRLTEAIRAKTTTYMSVLQAQAESGHHAVVATLEKTFGLHIPRSIEPIILKRLLTVAARTYYERVTPEVASLLKAVGAKVPEIGTGGNLDCYGVLHERNNRKCIACGVRESCAVETVNYGLDTVVLGPKLVGARGVARMPHLTGDLPGQGGTPMDEMAPMDKFEDELRSYLDENFEGTRQMSGLYYAHKEVPRGAPTGHLFKLTRRKGRLTVNFLNPNPVLAPGLIQDGLAFYPAEDAEIGQVLDLVNECARLSLLDLQAPPEALSIIKEIPMNTSQNPPPSTPTQTPAPKASQATNHNREPKTPEEVELTKLVRENFKIGSYGADLYLITKTPEKARKDGTYLFWFGRVDASGASSTTGNLALRFCRPNATLIPKLVQLGAAYYAPASLGPADLLDLMKRHESLPAGPLIKKVATKGAKPAAKPAAQKAPAAPKAAETKTTVDSTPPAAASPATLTSDPKSVTPPQQRMEKMLEERDAVAETPPPAHQTQEAPAPVPVPHTPLPSAERERLSRTLEEWGQGFSRLTRHLYGP